MPGWQTRDTQDSGNNTSDWQKMLTMYTLAGNNDANTMLGFALGKLLNQGWMDHLARRHDKEYQDYVNRNKTANALAGTATGTPLGQVASNPYSQSYAQNYNDQQFSDALAQGVASGKIKPEFAENIATGGWNVGNAVPDYLKGTAQATATQNNPYAKLLGTIDPNSPMGRIAASTIGNGITLGTNQYGWKPSNNEYWTKQNFFTLNGNS